MTRNKINLLFIAKNIPVPGMYSSRVIIEIAHKISDFSNVTFLFPKELVPPGIHLLKKYRPIYKLQAWECEGYKINIYPYSRIPFKTFSYMFWNKLSAKGMSFYDENGPFDLIHAHYLLPDGYLAYLFSKQFQIPYFVTIRNADIKHLKSLSPSNHDFKKAALVIRNASQVLSMNLAYKKYLDGLFSIDSQIIPHGLEDRIYAAKKSSNDNGNTVNLITIAEAIQRKNIDWVIKAVKSYSGPESVKLQVVGDGQLMLQLKKIAGNDPRISFTGRVPHDKVLELLGKSDVFALPSFDETFGMVYLEAAAKQNALIGLENEGVWGIFEDNKEMIFSKDETDFQKLLHQLIDDEGQRKNLALKAFQRSKELNWRHISQKYEDTYSSAIDQFKKNKSPNQA